MDTDLLKAGPLLRVGRYGMLQCMGGGVGKLSEAQSSPTTPKSLKLRHNSIAHTVSRTPRFESREQAEATDRISGT